MSKKEKMSPHYVIAWSRPGRHGRIIMEYRTALGQLGNHSEAQRLRTKPQAFRVMKSFGLIGAGVYRVLPVAAWQFTRVDTT